MIILNYSILGFSGDIEAITKELTKMSVTKLRIKCEGKSVQRSEISALRQNAITYLEEYTKGKYVVIDLAGYGEELFYENEIAYIKTIDLQVEIKEK